MTRPCASRTLLSSCLRGQCRLTLWGTLDARASRRGPAQAFSSIAAMYPVLASATAARPLAVRSRLGPNVDGVAGRIQRSELLPSRGRPAGLSKPCTKDTPFVAGLPPRRSPTLGVGAFRATRDRWFRRAACAHTGCGPWACGSGSPTRSAGG